MFQHKLETTRVAQDALTGNRLMQLGVSASIRGLMARLGNCFQATQGRKALPITERDGSSVIG